MTLSKKLFLTAVIILALILALGFGLHEDQVRRKMGEGEYVCTQVGHAFGLEETRDGLTLHRTPEQDALCKEHHD